MGLVLAFLLTVDCYENDFLGYVDIVPRQLYSNLLMRVSGATIRPPGLQTNFYERENAVKSVTHRPGRGAGRLVSVGFLGNFCQYGSEDHSVTLLTKGVITHLNRSEFSVKLISTARSMTEDECKQVKFDSIFLDQFILRIIILSRASSFRVMILLKKLWYCPISV